jgi:outer membrane protein OmpA-like peptidoglycan-associated protein
MKNNITITLLFIFLLGFLVPINAQDQKLTKATSSYDRLDYVDAQKIYLAVAEKGYTSEELFSKLANTYYFNAQYGDAVKWYGKLFELNQNPKSPIDLLRYSQSLNATGNHQKAAKYYDIFIAKNGTDPKAIKVIDYLNLIQQNSGRYQLHPIDAIYDEDRVTFGHTKVGNKLVYAATVDNPTILNTKNAWDGLSFLSLYEIELDQDNVATGKPTKIRGKLNSRFHESSPIYTKDGNTMYLTRSNLTAKNRKNDQNLKIYRSVKKDNVWQKPEELHFNSDVYSSAHPALSPDETKLYFSSDRPGGFGESDLYVASIATDGTIGKPVNLGPDINTAGKETFPFVSEDNELYFSSDGHFGLGGMDVFYVKIKNGGYGNLLNVGAPINSYADDFSFGINKETKKGFISTNRSQSEGTFVHDNIYTFIETEPIKEVYQAKIDGYVTDKQTGLPIAGATVALTDSEGKLFQSLTTNADGYYAIETNRYNIYTIRASQELYDTDEKISKSGLEQQTINFQLQKNKAQIIPGTDLAEVLNIPIIYFDFDKWNLRPEAEIELQKVLEVLREHPALKIDIRSHTDSRGSDSYNMTLSNRRAKSTMEYFIAHGIDRDRLTARGFGETQLVNYCGNNIECTEAEHQQNRRSEFIVKE